MIACFAFSASRPFTSGTVICATPCDTVTLTFEPFSRLSPAFGSWPTICPAGTLSSYFLSVVPSSKPASFKMAVASSTVLPVTLGTGSPEAKPPMRANAARPTMASAAMTPTTMPMVFLLFFFLPSSER